MMPCLEMWVEALGGPPSSVWADQTCPAGPQGDRGDPRDAPLPCRFSVAFSNGSILLIAIGFHAISASQWPEVRIPFFGLQPNHAL